MTYGAVKIMPKDTELMEVRSVNYLFICVFRNYRSQSVCGRERCWAHRGRGPQENRGIT